ncbi:hypothetical protein GCM10010446_37370 [Streptomyces enissocaesilis]|uniref:Uncharacterized protein n=1 Tax=Streptomyces enissocaesilis TaxID=332589 RepID=A0ABN3XCG1_9ACTN
MEVVDTALLPGLEERADPAWMRADGAYEGSHCLWSARWNSLSHRPGVPRRLRCELLFTLCTGERVMSLLDMLPDAFAPLPRVTSREEGMRVSRLLDCVPAVGEWLLRGGEGSPGRLDRRSGQVSEYASRRKASWMSSRISRRVRRRRHQERGEGALGGPALGAG